jgi:alcohol dehydrogenase class IV
MLPRVLETMRPRAARQVSALARALGAKRAEIGSRVEELGGGRRRLSELGAERDKVGEAVKGILARPELAMTPDTPDEAEIRELIASAW